MNNEELVERIQAGEYELLEKLYEQNKGILFQTARKFRGMEPLEDLMQQAYIGLHEAVFRFDASVGTAFLTYATYWISQSLYRYVENCGRVIRVPIKVQALYYQYNRFV